MIPSITYIIIRQNNTVIFIGREHVTGMETIFLCFPHVQGDNSDVSLLQVKQGIYNFDTAYRLFTLNKDLLKRRRIANCRFMQ